MPGLRVRRAGRLPPRGRRAGRVTLGAWTFYGVHRTDRPRHPPPVNLLPDPGRADLRPRPAHLAVDSRLVGPGDRGHHERRRRRRVVSAEGSQQAAGVTPHVGRPQQRDDHLASAHRRGPDEAAASGTGVAGLADDRRRVPREQAIVRTQGDVVDPTGLDRHLDGSRAEDLAELRIAQPVAEDHGQIARAGDVSVHGQTVGVLEVRGRGPEQVRLGRHAGGEPRLAAGEALGHHDRRIVRRLEQHRVDEIPELDALPGAESHAGGRRVGGVVAHGELVVQPSALEGEHGGHHLGGARRGQRHVPIVVVQDRARTGIDHDRGPRGEGQLCPREHRREHHHGRERGECPRPTPHTPPPHHGHPAAEPCVEVLRPRR